MKNLIALSLLFSTASVYADFSLSGVEGDTVAYLYESLDAVKAAESCKEVENSHSRYSTTECSKTLEDLNCTKVTDYLTADPTAMHYSFYNCSLKGISVKVIENKGQKIELLNNGSKAIESLYKASTVQATASDHNGYTKYSKEIGKLTVVRLGYGYFGTYFLK